MMIESVIMQITGVEIQSLVQSVIALVTALTAIGAVIAKFIQTHTQNQKVKTWADVVSKDLNETKKSLQATDQWVLENQSKFTNAMAVVNQILTPEQQKSLAIQGIDIQNLQKELDNVTREITTIYSTIPAEKANVPTPTL
jgi:lipopolysaccharide export LptBFGC system permease protein LptF